MDEDAIFWKHEAERLREALEDARRTLLEADSDAVKILDKALKGGK